MARPIAKRRAGLLGALPDGGKDSLLFAFGCCPVRFDLDHSLFASQIVMEAAPYPILRTLRQSTLYWITVNITQLLDGGWATSTGKYNAGFVFLHRPKQTGGAPLLAPFEKWPAAPLTPFHLPYATGHDDKIFTNRSDPRATQPYRLQDAHAA